MGKQRRKGNDGMGEKSVNPAETVVAKENKKAYNRPVIETSKNRWRKRGLKCIAQEK